MSAHPRLRIRYQLVIFSASRIVINTMYRMIYPFMAVFARGMGVEVGAVASVVAARSALGLAAPAMGAPADKYGRKAGMLLGLGIFVVGAGLVLASPRFTPFAVALMLATAGKIIFDPAMQAYLGDTVGYNRRGQAIAATELGWSLAFLLGVPVMGWLIEQRGWTAPFPFLAVAGALAAFVLWRSIPSRPAGGSGSPSLSASLRMVASHGPAVAALLVGFLLSSANETVNIVFGIWLEASFGLKVAALGAAAAAIGLAELAGEGMVAALADRLGKQRSIAVGILLNCGACLLLPVLGVTLPGALAALFLFYFTFEFTLVSSIPLMTELVPGARASAMSGNIASLSAGRMVGAIAGAALFALGLRANTGAALVLNLVALGILLRFVRD
ncbi:MAG TPA: MFS transporter [Anaerolineales bacterium]|nr:MFS transporter [Anaerolineales bacterium]